MRDMLLSEMQAQAAKDTAYAKNAAEKLKAQAKELRELAEKQRNYAAKNEAKAEQAERLYEGNAEFYSRATDPVTVLSSGLQKKTGWYAEVLGPFGLNGNMSIVLTPQAGINRFEQKHRWLDIRRSDEDWNRLIYRTGEVKDTYPKGSIDEINGGNDVYAPLPDDLDEILALMPVQEACYG